MNCSNEAAPAKALCVDCLALAAKKKTQRKDDWDNRTSRSITSQEVASLNEASAPHFSRILAYIFDSTILLVISSILFWVACTLIVGSEELAKFQNLQKNPRAVSPMVGTLQLILSLSAAMNLLPAWIYYVAFECSNLQATPGKLLVGLKVVGEDGVNFGVATKRFLIKYLALFVPLIIGPILTAGCFGIAVMMMPLLIVLIVSVLVGFIDPLFVIFSSQRRGIHDIFAGTQVIRFRKVALIEIFLCILAIIITMATYLIFSILIA